ncbi:MAG: hypothetical protein M3282_12035 [Gemmatimonadota bacterium]|nr:hypothetical protein [Gemmatimonadota bacterium]
MLTTFLFMASLVQSAQTAAVQGWRVTSLDLDARVTPEQRLLRVGGSLQLAASAGATATPALVFGPGGVVFDSASLDVPAGTRYSGRRDTLFITLPRSPVANTVVTVWFAGHADRDIGRNQIRHTGAMISWNALWYPSLATARDAVPQIEFPGTTRISVPARWRTLSPGVLIDSVVAGDWRTETWQVATATARSFVAAEFVPTWTIVGGAPVAVYLLPRHAARREEFARAIPPMVSVLARYFGAYPFGGFGIAELPSDVAPPGFGGRSEPGYFIAHTDALEGPLNVALFAHELAHMWFPNSVDSRPPGDDMMDEAIASYAVALYKEATSGRDSARAELVQGNPDFSMRAYFHEIRRGADEPLMADYSPIVARAKGPMVYDMLRRRVGDSVFFGVWRDFGARVDGSVSLADLRAELLRRAPHDTGLAAFLSQWLDRTGAPVVTVRRVSPARVELVQHGVPYALDLPLRIGGRDTVVHVAASRAELRARGPVEIDPRDEVLVWKARFGPPPDAPASWPLSQFRTWLGDEAEWLMRGYAVNSASIAVVRSGRALWSNTFGRRGSPGTSANRRGDERPSADARCCTAAALIDSLRAHSDSGSWRRLVADGNDVTLLIGRPREGVGAVVRASGGWGGRQLVLHLAQRVAIQHRWGEIPR